MIGAKTKQQLILEELDRANRTIIKADALVTIDDDGEPFTYIDPEKMPADFLDYYSELVSSCYLLGAMR